VFVAGLKRMALFAIVPFISVSEYNSEMWERLGFHVSFFLQFYFSLTAF
jgi:hypothetical protein